MINSIVADISLSSNQQLAVSACIDRDSGYQNHDDVKIKKNRPTTTYYQRDENGQLCRFHVSHKSRIDVVGYCQVWTKENTANRFAEYVAKKQIVQSMSRRASCFWKAGGLMLLWDDPKN